MNSKKTGAWGEKIAENYLKKKGYEILEKNYSTNLSFGLKRGEIDIIAREKDIVIFIEVKTILQRKQAERVSPFSPEDKVNFEKQKKIIKTAQSWLMKNKISLNSKWQIDVITVKINSDKNSAKIAHFKNAVFC